MVSGLRICWYINKLLTAINVPENSASLKPTYPVLWVWDFHVEELEAFRPMEVSEDQQLYLVKICSGT